MNINCDGTSSTATAMSTSNQTKSNDTANHDTTNIANTELKDSISSSGTTVYGDFGTPVGECNGATEEKLSIWTALFMEY